MSDEETGQAATHELPRWAPSDIADMRKRAKKGLTEEIDLLMLPKGFTRKGARWQRRGLFYDVYLEFQKDRYGFACYFNLGRKNRILKSRLSSYGEHWRLNSFLPTVELRDTYDRHDYVDLDGDTPRRREILAQIAEIGLPLLERMAGWRAFWVKTPPPNR